MWFCAEPIRWTWASLETAYIRNSLGVCMVDFIKIIKYTNVCSKNNETGRGVTQYKGITKIERMPNGTDCNWGVRINKKLAMSLVGGGLPFETEEMTVITF